MIRMTKQTDYGFVLLSHLANEAAGEANAPDLAAETKLPLPMVSKILKLLVRQGLLVSHRGVKGGYSLARPASTITAAEILKALEGPVALTVCIEGSPGECEHEHYCTVRGPWQRINREIFAALAFGEDGVVATHETVTRGEERAEPPLFERHRMLQGWRADEIRLLLELGQFRTIQLSGGFAEEPFDRELSDEIVVVAS